MKYQISKSVVLAVTALLIGCLGEPTPAEVEAELDELLENLDTITVRDCTCGTEASAASSHSDRFEGWPDYSACLQENRQAARDIGDYMADSRAFVLEYLDPRISGDQPVSEYWHHDSRRGTYYFQRSCRQTPADEPCGWRSESFSEFSVTTRSQYFPACEGEDDIESAVISTAIDEQAPRSLPSSLLEEMEE